MLFSSVSFLFMFLPLVCAAYFLVRRELKNDVLLAASILFYAWGEPRYLAVMLTTILINYAGAMLIDRHRSRGKLILALSVVADLSFLFYFKYFNFVLTNVNSLFHAGFEPLNVVMPIGISFYTFQAMSYLVDVYRGETPVQKSVYKLALYVSLFPQLIAGPIVKYRDVADQIDGREESFDKVAYGAKRFTVGLAKKMLIANTLGAVADKIFEQPINQFSVSTAWIGAFAYAFQLYYDFSGYSDMAIGLGSIFGFKFLENFNYPYISKSITEFWRRWHISLSTWFKEYLYIPLGGNRVSKRRNLFNLFVVFLATGVWHGAAWTFVVWGLWHGLFIIIEKATGFAKKEGGRAFTALKHVYTIAVFLFGWILFRADTVRYASQYVRRMFGVFRQSDVAFDLSYYIDRIEILAFIAAFVCAMPVFKNMLTVSPERKVLYALVNVWMILLFVLSAAFVAASTYNPFIYFRF